MLLEFANLIHRRLRFRLLTRTKYFRARRLGILGYPLHSIDL
jgi:hypothetical protein